MRMNRKYWILGVIGVALFLVAGGELLANHFGVAQRWSVNVGFGGGREIKVYNPTDKQFFALLIETFIDPSEPPVCAGGFVGPGTYEQLANRLGRYRIDGQSRVDVLAVPTTVPILSNTRDHNLGVLVTRGTRSYPLRTAAVTGFIPGKGVKGCVCGVVKDFGLPKALFKNFGLACAW